MHDLEKALADITAIRSQMARGTQFQGYGPLTLAATGVLAVAAGGIQTLWLPDAADHPFEYLVLWIATAAISIALVAVETVARSRRIHSGLADEMIHAATEQFVPAGVAGTLLTLVLFRFAPQTLWMLPGLWQLVFSLGLFACARSLPRGVFAVAVWYLVAGLGSLAIGAATPFSPWLMALPFGLGQLMMAGIVYFSVEADDVD